MNCPTRATWARRCVTVTWLQLNAHLLRLTGEARFAEQLERVVYNQLCGAQRPDGKAWGYYVEMEGKKPYTATLDGQCCLSSGPRGLALVPTFAITTDADGAVVNFYDAGEADLRLRDGAAVKLAIETRYPASGQDRHRRRSGRGPRVRRQAAHPRLVCQAVVAGQRPASGRGQRRPTAMRPSSGLGQQGDKVELVLKLEPRLVLGEHTNRNKAAVLYGPLVLAADAALTGGRHVNSLRLASGNLAELAVTAEPVPRTDEDLARRPGVSRQRGRHARRAARHSDPTGAVCRCRRDGHALQGVAAVADRGK